MRPIMLAPLLAPLLVLAILPAAHAASPWDGAWVLDPARSSPGAKDMAAPGYVFHIDGDRIRWEIPSLGEVVTGRTNGDPMAVHRDKPTPGMTLSVWADPTAETAAPPTLLYEVRRNGMPAGGGRMTLVENGRAWVDLSWPHGHEIQGGELVYVRQPGTE